MSSYVICWHLMTPYGIPCHIMSSYVKWYHLVTNFENPKFIYMCYVWIGVVKSIVAHWLERWCASLAAQLWFLACPIQRQLSQGGTWSIYFLLLSFLPTQLSWYYQIGKYTEGQAHIEHSHVECICWLTAIFVIIISIIIPAGKMMNVQTIRNNSSQMIPITHSWQAI